MKKYTIEIQHPSGRTQLLWQNPQKPLLLFTHWIIQKTKHGFRIRSIGFAAGAIAEQSFVEKAPSELQNGTSLKLPLSEKEVWIKLIPFQTLPPAYEPQGISPDSEPNLLQAHECSDEFILQTQSFKNEITLSQDGQAVCHIKSLSTGQLQLIPLHEKLELHTSNQNDTSLSLNSPIELQMNELGTTKLCLEGRTWRFSQACCPHLPSPELPGTKRKLSHASLMAAAMIGLLLWGTSNDVKQEDEEEELIPAQYTEVILEEQPTREPSSQPVAAESNSGENVARSIQSKNVQDALGKVLQGGIQDALAQKDLAQNAKEQNQNLFQAEETKGQDSLGHLVGKLNEETTEVAQAGGEADELGGAFGYSEGAEASVEGQGTGEVEVDFSGGSVEQGLTKDEVGKVIHAHVDEVRFCYEDALLRNPELGGKVVVDFSITPDGRVDQASFDQPTIEDPRLTQCIIAKLNQWKFPKPRGGTHVAVNYPFLFQSIGR